MNQRSSVTWKCLQCRLWIIWKTKFGIGVVLKRFTLGFALLWLVRLVCRTLNYCLPESCLQHVGYWLLTSYPQKPIKKKTYLFTFRQVWNLTVDFLLELACVPHDFLWVLWFPCCWLVTIWWSVFVLVLGWTGVLFRVVSPTDSKRIYQLHTLLNRKKQG